MKCETCGDEIHQDCDYRQGRCPHRKPMLTEIMCDQYKTRFYNLLQSIKKFFTKGDCDCGHKH